MPLLSPKCFVAFSNVGLGHSIRRYKIAIEIAADHSDFDCSLLRSRFVVSRPSARHR